MDKLRRLLPPTEPLIAFEAAARLENFTRAAEELNLSQAAVSQQIKRLEANLGAPLFTRSQRRVRLTSHGRALQHTVSAALRQIAAASEEIRAAPDAERLTIATDHSIAAMWLAPRLPMFRAEAPDTEIRIVATDDEDECLAEGADVVILHGTGNWPGWDAHLLFQEEVFPVCAPEYLKTAPPLTHPSDIQAHTLIHLEDSRWDWLDWRNWLSRVGVDAPVPRGSLRCNTYPLVIDAAIRGQGIALGWAHLVDQNLARKELFRPALPSLKTRFGYHAATEAGREKSATTQLFLEWLTTFA